MKTLLLALFISVNASASVEVLWKKPFWGWGQASSTNVASSKALENARPAIAAMRAECDIERGVLSYTTQGGYCTQTVDPMFCPGGCYNCPIYGTGTCTFDTSVDIKVGALVEATADANLFSGTTAVDKVKMGDRFHVMQIQNNWVSLERLDGTRPKGWIQIGLLKAVTL